MKYTLAIDVPSLEEMTQDPYKVELLKCCISAVGRLKDSVLTMTGETAMEVLYTNIEMCSMLSNVRLDIYDNGIRKNFLSTNPDMITNINDTEKQEQEYLLCCRLHIIPPHERGIFAVCPSRWSTPKCNCMQTIRDKKTLEHHVVLLSDNKAFGSLIKNNWPKLEQHKHGAKGYMRAGKQVSPLTATMQEAEVLLRKAFIDAQIPEDVIFPERLYTWDSKSNTYVEFRRSSGSHLVNEYHGFDLDKKYWNSVPEYIKNIYHHW